MTLPLITNVAGAGGDVATTGNNEPVLELPAPPPLHPAKAKATKIQKGCSFGNANAVVVSAAIERLTRDSDGNFARLAPARAV
jgi:hypothetical protein